MESDEVGSPDIGSQDMFPIKWYDMIPPDDIPPVKITPGDIPPAEITHFASEDHETPKCRVVFYKYSTSQEAKWWVISCQ